MHSSKIEYVHVYVQEILLNEHGCLTRIPVNGFKGDWTEVKCQQPFPRTPKSFSNNSNKAKNSNSNNSNNSKKCDPIDLDIQARLAGWLAGCWLAGWLDFMDLYGFS